MKRMPFEVSYKGESIDPKFFKRLLRFEDYYKNLLKEDSLFESNYESIKMINSFLQRDELGLDDISHAINAYNSANSKPHHDGSGWFDLRLHLRHIAFVYGKEFETDKDLNLILKEPDDNK